jgi:hypothetical protein
MYRSGAKKNKIRHKTGSLVVINILYLYVAGIYKIIWEPLQWQNSKYQNRKYPNGKCQKHATENARIGKRQNKKLAE